MYKVKVLVVKEVVVIEVEAKYCFVDGNNNLVFQDELLPVGEPLAVISSSRWIVVQRTRG